MNQQIHSLKRFVGWVTDLTDKYRFDPNIRTTVQIVILQVGLTALSVVIFGWAIQYAQEDTIGSITEHVREVVSGVSTSADSLPQTIQQVRTRTYTIVFMGLVVLNLLFGYLMAHFALRPTRQTISFQKRFIGNIAHEIRTPLAIIKTSTEVALFDPHISKDAKETMEETIVELNRISETINNLLSFDSLTRPKTMRFEHTNLAEIARTVADRHRELAETRGITLTTHFPETATIEGNATALDQVLTNLLKNALHYTPPHTNGHVTITIGHTQSGNTALSVTDTGIGIEQKDLYHILEPYYRADTSRARGVGTGSSGLGLAIVNEIVRLHHGSITMRSAVGQGTSVKISLPPALAGNLYSRRKLGSVDEEDDEDFIFTSPESS